MKTLIAVLTAYFVAAVALTTGACRLMNLASDSAVLAGIALLVVAVIGTLVLIPPVIRLAKQRVASANGDGQARIVLAEAEAKANEALSRSLTPSLLDWRRLALTEAAIAKWDGRRPMVEGSNGQGLLLQVTPAALGK